jgi:TolA-binding protein
MSRNLLSLILFASMLPLQAAAQNAVQSQEGIALENQILQLQNQMQQLQNGGGNGGGSALGGASNPAPSGSGAAPDSSIVTNLLNQVQQLQSQVQTLNGQVDTLQNQVNTQHDQTEKEIGDLKFQMSNGGAAPPSAPSAAAPTPPAANAPQSLTGGTLGTIPTPPQAPPAAAPAAAVPASPKAALHLGQVALNKHDYPTAQTEAQSILTSHASSPESYQAQYLLAEALAGQGKNSDAAVAYGNAYNKNPSGTEAPAALLGLANSLIALHDNDTACQTLSTLTSEFPTPPSGMQPRIDSANKRAHCS